jgi:hypothetical protein
MIVFDLRCAAAHVFEAWFGSTGDYEAQLGRGLIECPICGDSDIGKAMMAPAVPAKGNRSSPPGPAQVKAALATLARAEAASLVADGVPVAPMLFRPRARSDA